MTKPQGTLFDDLPAGVGPISYHPLYRVRRYMLRRCYCPNDPSFHRYGLRGIYVCDEWLASARAFVAWAIKAGWQRGLQLDRENNDGPYSPDNCRFVTPLVNTNNRRNTRRLSDGTPLADASRSAGLSRGAVDARLRRGLSADEAVSRPLASASVMKYFLADGTPLMDAVRQSGLACSVVYSRLRRGMSPDDAVSVPRGSIPRPSRYRMADGTNLADAIRASGLSRKTVMARLRVGWLPDDAVSVPPHGKRPAASAPSIKGKGRK